MGEPHDAQRPTPRPGASMAVGKEPVKADRTAASFVLVQERILQTLRWATCQKWQVLSFLAVGHEARHEAAGWPRGQAAGVDDGCPLKLTASELKNVHQNPKKLAHDPTFNNT